MSEEAAAFARHDESPFPIVPDDAADAADIPPPGQSATDSEPGSPGNLDGSGPADPIVATVLSADSRQFVRALISQVLAAADDAGLGIALSRLGQALAEDWRDETLTFQSLVDGLDRGRLDEAALRRLVPIVAAFVTRRVTGEMAPDEPEALHRLLSAAQTVVEETLAAGGSRQWRRLPRFAA